MKNLVIQNVKITATSNKQSAEFVSQNPKKTVYIEVDKDTEKALNDFGVPTYTSEDEQDFLCIKIVDEVGIYYGATNEKIKMDTSLNAPNFKTRDGVTVAMNIVKGEKAGNKFTRISSILLKESSDIENIKEENPFADMFN